MFSIIQKQLVDWLNDKHPSKVGIYIEPCQDKRFYVVTSALEYKYHYKTDNNKRVQLIYPGFRANYSFKTFNKFRYLIIFKYSTTDKETYITSSIAKQCNKHLFYIHYHVNSQDLGQMINFVFKFDNTLYYHKKWIVKSIIE